MPSLASAVSKNVLFSAGKSRALLSFPLLSDPKCPNICQCALPRNLRCSAALKFRSPLNRAAWVCHPFSTDAAEDRRRNDPTSRLLVVQMWGRDRFAMAKITGVMTAFFVAVSLYASSAGASTPEEAFVKETVSSHDIVIFSKSYCPYCKRAKAVFKELSKEPHVIELDQRDDGMEIQDALRDMVGKHTVPQVFVNGQHLGGSDDIVEAYESGKLSKLLNDIREDGL